MATLATKFGRFMGRAAEDETAAPHPAREDGARIRPFANEDIYFFVKHIDNSAVIRAQDPEQDRASWKMIGVSVAAAALLIVTLLPKGYGVLAGYQIQQLREEQVRLQHTQDVLAIEEAQLMSPERMTKLAKQQQFVDPTSEKIVYLDNSGDDTGLAAKNQAKK
jgi:hypothetical protein